MSGLGAYRKTGAAVIGSVLTWTGAAYVPDGHITRPEWYALALALATALGVYAVTNDRTPPLAPQPPVELTPAGSIPLGKHTGPARDEHGRWVSPSATTSSTGA